ncbi:hypothetical protein FJZ27_03315 [Candidatus Peribacteria bacterium]|nr:hypothetical protein [Candidatus Peribacteria bacterium]
MLPVTIISGFAGAGKTRFLLDCLKRTKGKRRAVIMNDIAETVSAAASVRRALSKKDALIEIPNGCICCNLDEQFLALVEEIAQQQFDHLFIEVNATGEPMLVQRLLERASVADALTLHSSVTVVDAERFLRDFLSCDNLRDRYLVSVSEDDRSVGEVLAEQVENVDTIVIRKEDLISAEELALFVSVMHSLNPSARILQRGEILQGNFAMPLSFSFTADRPFHPERLHALLQTDALSSVIRARGTAWFATRNDRRIFWSQTGSICTLESDGKWWAEDHEHPEQETSYAEWFEACGQRFQSIEFVAMHGKESLHKKLNDCLLTETEMELGLDLWQYFHDPFDEWLDHMDRSSFVVRSSIVSAL